MEKPVDVFRWLPCPVVFICTAHEDQRDIMTATAMFVSETDPLIAVSAAQGHLTDRLIDRSGEFTVVIASTEQKELAIRLGSTRGENEDKYERFDVAVLPGKSTPSGVPAESAAWMQCRVEQRLEVSGYTVRVGRVAEQENLGKAPLIWQEDSFFGLSRS